MLLHGKYNDEMQRIEKCTSQTASWCHHLFDLEHRGAAITFTAATTTAPVAQLKGKV
jgi:hypothetical protein